MIKGEISLYDEDDSLVRFSIYQDSRNRKQLFQLWGKQIGYKFFRMYVHVYPICDLNRISKDGKNSKGPIKRYREMPSEKIIRPQAKYDNDNKSLYDG